MSKVRARICKLLWSPGIDSEESIPPAYVVWRGGTKNRVVVPARQAGNPFLGFLEGLQIRALVSSVNWIVCIQCTLWTHPPSPPPHSNEHSADTLFIIQQHIFKCFLVNFYQIDVVCRPISSRPFRQPIPTISVWALLFLVTSPHCLCPRVDHRVHKVATAAFWRTFSHEGQISPGWWGWGVPAHPLSLHLPSPVKLHCTLQLSGQTY